MTFRIGRSLACAAASLFLLSSPASGEIVYDSGVDLKSFLIMMSSDVSTGYQAAGGLVVDAPAVVNHVQWTGTYGPVEALPHETFAISFFDDADGLPGASLGTPQTVTAERIFAGESGPGMLYTYSAHIADTHLESNRRYYLSIVNQTPGSTDWWWVGGFTSNMGTFTRQAAGNPPEPWAPTASFGLPTVAALTLSHATVAAVPEPTSLATLAFCATVGCGGAARLWKRRQPQRVA